MPPTVSRTKTPTQSVEARPQSSRAGPASNGQLKAQSVMSRIRKIQPGGAVKLSLYGQGKTGKTRLACSFPKPLLLIGTEDGTKSVSDVEGVDFVRLERSDELRELCDMLAASNGPTADPEKNYQTAILDTGGGLQDMILKEILGLDELPVQRTWGMARQQDWMACGAQWKESLGRLFHLSDRSGLHVIVIAHERTFTSEDAEGSELVNPTVGSALTPKVAAWLNAECDYVCQCFKRSREEVKQITVGQGKAAKVMETKIKTGKVDYCLRVGPHAVYQTGFRLPRGIELPDVIVDADYEKIAALIEGRQI